MSSITVPGAGYQRQELGTCLPLATPFALHINPSHSCNLKCGYCLHSLPAGEKPRGFRNSLMPFEIFTKCIEDATRFPEQLKVLILAGWGEPLLHPRIAEMVAFAKEKRVAGRIEIVSNGVLLTPQLSDRLVAAGLDRLRISVQGIDSERCGQVAGVPLDFDSLVQNVGYFHAHRDKCRLFVKTVDTAVASPEDAAFFRGTFEGICDEIAIEQVIPVTEGIDHSKFGTDLNKRHCGGDASEVKVCPFPFYLSVVHPDGSYGPCCSPSCRSTWGTSRSAPSPSSGRGRDCAPSVSPTWPASVGEPCSAATVPGRATTSSKETTSTGTPTSCWQPTGRPWNRGISPPRCHPHA